MKISIVQTDIIWENKQENLRLLREKLLPLRGTTEIVVLPEMFTTGFSMNSRTLAEPISGFTIRTLKGYVAEFQFALVGSFICEEAGAYYNRAFLITPDGQDFYYDKRHLFRMGCETEHFSAGNRRVIVPYRGWNICLQVCYDLRFPVWSRNINNEYDLHSQLAYSTHPCMEYTTLRTRYRKPMLRMRCEPYRTRRQRTSLSGIFSLV